MARNWDRGAPILVDAYGLERRHEVLPALQRSQLLGAELIKYWPVDAASLRHRANDLEWLQTVIAGLAGGL